MSEIRAHLQKAVAEGARLSPRTGDTAASARQATALRPEDLRLHSLLPQAPGPGSRRQSAQSPRLRADEGVGAEQRQQVIGRGGSVKIKSHSLKI